MTKATSAWRKAVTVFSRPPFPLVAALAAIALFPAQAASDEGEDLFNKKCRTCHKLEPGKHTLGPSLAGIVGKKAGTTDFTRYKALKGSDVIWNEENLSAWIENPKEFIGAKTSMVVKIKDEDDRKAIIEYLKKH